MPGERDKAKTHPLPIGNMAREKDKMKRRWWQLSLRDLFLWTLIAGLSIGWWLDRRYSELGQLRRERDELRLGLTDTLDRVKAALREFGFDFDYCPIESL